MDSRTSIKKLVESITQKHKSYGIDINAPATTEDIVNFEQKTGFLLPEEFKEFYCICNGFGCVEDIFNMTPLSEITMHPDNYGHNWFYFSEYMIYSDMWGLRVTSSGEYEIFNGSYSEKIMTSSLIEFLNRFYKGNVFDAGGLYEWHEQLGIN